MDHVKLSTHATYDEAFEAASIVAGSRRKKCWKGCVRIKFRKSTNSFEVQVPT